MSHISQQSGLEETPTQRMRLAAGQQSSTLHQRIINKGLGFSYRRVIDQRPDLYTRLQAIAHRQACHALEDALGQCVIDP
ncbi:hypothetical protein D3C80_1916350 [compost metagenome]